MSYPEEIRRLAEEFVYQPLVDIRYSDWAPLSDGEIDAVADFMLSWADSQGEPAARDLLIWNVRLLYILKREERRGLEEVLLEGERQGFVQPREGARDSLRQPLSSAAEMWRKNAGSIFHAATLVVGFLLARDASDDADSRVSEGWADVAPSIEFLVSENVLEPFVAGELQSWIWHDLWSPVAHTDEQSFVHCALGTARRLEHRGAEVLGAALLVACALGCRYLKGGKATARVLLSEAVNLFAAPLYDRALVLMRLADAAAPFGDQIPWLDEAIDLLQPPRTLAGSAYPDIAAHSLAFAFMQRGIVKEMNPIHGPRAAASDFQKSIELAEALRQRLGSGFPDSWTHDLARTYWGRGNVRGILSEHGPASAASDYDNAIDFLDVLRTRMGADFPVSWTEDLALAYLHRGTMRAAIVEYGPRSALYDYEKAIEILGELERSESGYPKTTFEHSLATAYINRGGTKYDLPEHGPLSTVADFESAIDLLEQSRSRLGEAFPPIWAPCLANAYLKRATLRRKNSDCDPLLVLSDYDMGISLLKGLQLQFGSEFYHHRWSEILASAYLSRGEFGQNLPEYGLASAMFDYEQAILLLECLQERLGSDFPHRWAVNLGGAFLNRGISLRETNPARALEDLYRAHELLSSEGTREASGGIWLRSAVLLSTALVDAGTYQEALEIILKAAAERLASVGQAMTSEERDALIKEGAKLSALGSWLLARLGRAGDAVLFLENQRGVRLKEAMLRDPQALIKRGVPDSQAETIARQRSRLHELRSLYGRPAEGGISDRFYENIYQEIRTLTEAFRRSVAGLPDPVLGASLSFEDMVSLVPDGGQIAVPVATEFGTIVILLNGAGEVRVLELRKLTEARVVEWLITIIDAENAGRSMDGALTSLLHAVWEEFMGPLFETLNEFGTSDSPLTFIVQDVFDTLPLHLAHRQVNGRIRFAIEDRVIRFSPGFTAIKLMKSRADDTEPGGVAGFFSPHRRGDFTPASNGGLYLRASLEQEKPALSGLILNCDWSGPEATRSQFLGLLTPAPWVEGGHRGLHLSMHAQFNLLRPDESSLYFVNDDGDVAPVSVSDILQIAPLDRLGHVCLASCQSGRSDVVGMPGESIGFVSAFIQAGAASVLSSYYTIDDAFAADAIPAIYRRSISENLDFAEALRAEFIARRNTETSGMLDAFVPFEDPAGSISISGWGALKATCSG